MENWRGYLKEEELVLNEEQVYYLSLFEEGNEQLLKEAMLDEGWLRDLQRTFGNLTDRVVGPVLIKMANYFSDLAERRGMSSDWVNKIRGSLASPRNITLAVVTAGGLIGMLLGQTDPAVLDAVQSAASPDVTSVYQTMNELGDLKDWVSVGLGPGGFGIATVLQKFGIDTGAGVRATRQTKHASRRYTTPNPGLQRVKDPSLWKRMTGQSE